MASITFFPSLLSGSATVPPSKSELHRALLLAALGTAECRLTGVSSLCDDTQAMISGITALGASVDFGNGSLRVTPGPARRAPAECGVRACAAALRMLIPVFLARGQAVRFRADASLLRRPLGAFEPLIQSLGARMTVTDTAVELEGSMPAGSYSIAGSLSSQFASGMLMALSAADGPSRLTVTGSIVSRPYLDMTLGMMERFHRPCAEISEGVFELRPSHEPPPAVIAVSGDWTQAAVLLCAGAMGGRVHIENLAQDSLQGDAHIIELLQRMKNGRAPEIDCSGIPDLAPILALACSQLEGRSALRGVGRLRVKESDRLAATQELLAKLGVRCSIASDGDTLWVDGPSKLRGGFEADARNDHRLVMLLAVAAAFCDQPVTVRGAECISKSWPGFLDTWRQLGGKAE